MHCAIEWQTDIRAEDWEKLFRRCQQTTLLQSYPYAQAMREVHKQGVRHGIIYINGDEAGIVQMQEVGLLKQMIHAISVDRGPLWFKGYGSAEHVNAFARALNRLYPDRLGRKRRFLPEIQQGNAKITLDFWKKSQATRDYKTIMVDLTPSIENIKKNFQKNWRNALTKSEKNKLTVTLDNDLDYLGGFLMNYIKDRVKKRYAGASPKFLSALSKYAAMQNECLLMVASEDGEVIASILVYQHAHGATYQAGWTTPYGREKGAHHLLLWNAIVELKKRGVTHFDLGGYNDETTGIQTFKEGLGGQNIALIGSYY